VQEELSARREGFAWALGGNTLTDCGFWASE
jgi:hypothetical protein